MFDCHSGLTKFPKYINIIKNLIKGECDMKKKLMTLFTLGILCMTTIIGCSAESEDKGGKSSVPSNAVEGDASVDATDKIPDASESDEIDNTTKYINDNKNKSSDKIAFISEDIILTFDYKDILKEKLVWDGRDLKNSVIEVQKYSRDSYEVWANIGDVSILSEFTADRLEEHELIATDGKWLLRKGNLDDAFVAHYVYKNEEFSYRAISFNIFNTEDTEKAKEKFEKIKSIVNVYFPDGDYLNVKDADGNDVSLAEYNFIQDILANLIAEQYAMNIADVQTIETYNSPEIHIEIPDDKLELVDYEIEYQTYNEHADLTPSAEFKLNGKLVKIYEEEEKVFVELNENSFLRFKYDIENESDFVKGQFKDLFIKHFQ